MRSSSDLSRMYTSLMSTLTERYCVEFFYHTDDRVIGGNQGQLNVNIIYVDGSRQRVLELNVDFRTYWRRGEWGCVINATLCTLS